MREIKFRAWDTENREMLPPFTLMQAIERQASPEMHTCDFMQYTGLKDKNGKEIFEGDVVKHGHKNEEITFGDGAFMSANIALSEWDVTNWEVISNIYENKELLK